MAPFLDKAAVALTLRNMGLLLQLKGENAFKTRAYELGADRIQGLTEDLGKLVTEGRLATLPGIGEALAKKITELVTTGKLGVYETLRAEFPSGVLELVQLPELGPRKVMALIQLLGVAPSRSWRPRAGRGGCARSRASERGPRRRSSRESSRPGEARAPGGRWARCCLMRR